MRSVECNAHRQDVHNLPFSSELERMEKEKQDALELAEAEKRRALNDAANEKDMALDKVTQACI